MTNEYHLNKVSSGLEYAIRDMNKGTKRKMRKTYWSKDKTERERREHTGDFFVYERKHNLKDITFKFEDGVEYLGKVIGQHFLLISPKCEGDKERRLAIYNGQINEIIDLYIPNKKPEHDRASIVYSMVKKAHRFYGENLDAYNLMLIETMQSLSNQIDYLGGENNWLFNIQKEISIKDLMSQQIFPSGAFDKTQLKMNIGNSDFAISPQNNIDIKKNNPVIERYEPLDTGIHIKKELDDKYHKPNPTMDAFFPKRKKTKTIISDEVDSWDTLKLKTTPNKMESDALIASNFSDFKYSQRPPSIEELTDIVKDLLSVQLKIQKLKNRKY